jgi:hypothetical protein
MPFCKSWVRAAVFGLTALFVFSGIDCAPAQEMMRRDGGMRGGDRGGGMRGIGTGIGIGIGTGLAVDAIQRSREAETPVNDGPRRSTKKTKRPKEIAKRPPRTEPEAQTSVTSPSQLKFVGKPDNVPHNPLQKEGKLGDLNDHKQAVVTKDSSYFRRHYYFTREGEQRTWFFFDVPISRDDPIIKLHKEVRSCVQNDDNCDGPPVINVDNPVRIIEDPTECAGAVTRVNMATSACVNGKVQLTEDHYNYCPPDKTNFHHTRRVLQTETVCGGGAVAWTPGLEDYRGKPCGVATDTGDTIQHPEPVGGIWVITVYKVYTCAGIPGQRFTDGNPVKVSDGNVADGGPTPTLDPASLATAGPI